MRALFPTLALALLCGAAAARDCRPALIPNGSVYDCLTCHRAFGGDVRNAFGLQVEAVVIPGGCDPFWDSALAYLDADGDGYTNGQELGDPFGQWFFPLPDPGSLLLVSHPAEATRTPPWGPVLLNEVFAATSTGQAIELRNGTLLPRALSGWWVAAQPGDGSFPLPAGLTAPASGLVVVHWNTAGVDQLGGGPVQHVFTGTGLAPLNTAYASLGLFRSSNFTSAAALASFMQYGQGNQSYAGLAAQAGLWPATPQYVPPAPFGHSLEYDGWGFAPADWRDEAAPSLGEDNDPPPSAVPRGLW